MLKGIVIGNVVSTRKHEALVGSKFLEVELIEKLLPHLDAGNPAITLELSEEERKALVAMLEKMKARSADWMGNR